MVKVLFEVTEDHLNTGLRGYPVGYCTTSYVDPIKGLFYRGKAVSELAHFTPEQMIYLLKHGKEPNKTELSTFSDELKKRATCPDRVIDHIKQLPRSCHPMKLFSSALLMLETTSDYQEDCQNLIAQIPHLVAMVINHHAGWGDTPTPSQKLGYMENFTDMIQVPNADKKRLTEVFKLFNILHYDHGGGNLSTFVGKAVASGLEDLAGSASAAMCALAGPRHGKANQDCLAFVQSVLDTLGDSATGDQVEDLIRKKLASKELVYGFGHAVLRAEDARATILYDYAEKHFQDNPLVKIALLLRERGPKVLKENEKISNPYPNVDAVSGTVLSAAGFGYPEYFTTLFGLSRVVGIAIQIVYERAQARDGKGLPIYRPKYLYLPT